MARAREIAVAASLLLALALLLAGGLRGDGVTNDEPLYIGAGWLQLTRGDYRLNTTHPPLGQKLAALGLLGLSPRTAPFEEGGDVMAWCYRFLHVDNDATAMMARARVPVALLTLALAALAWTWARQAASPRAGLLALGLAAFHPSLIAHGHLATTDAAAACAMLAASWSFWRWTRRPSWPWAAVSAVALGAALATRLTSAVLLPCFAVLAAGALRGHARKVALRHALALAACAAVLVPATIWAAYGFRDPPMPAPTAASAHGSPREDTAAGVLARLPLLPAAYLEGARFQAEHNRRGHLAYLLGERSRTGWRHYFAVAFLVKSTPGWLLVLALATGAAIAGGAGADSPRWHWLLPAAATFAAVSAGHIQIGERYLLPVHVYLVPWAAAVLATWTQAGARPRLRAAVVGVALALHAVPAVLAARQGHLAYFNLFAGGPTGGHRLLLDSNLDWGQDLPRLAAWMRQRQIGSVQLAYMGTDDPARYGIDREDLPGQRLHPERPARRPLSGTVAISPNLLFGLAPGVAAAYVGLRDRPPDDRAGVFFIYRLGTAPENSP
jgi:hypothetical protein